MKTTKIISAGILSMLCVLFLSFTFKNHEPKGAYFGSNSHIICAGVKAQLCGDCGFGNKKDNCAKCGKWVASSGVQAMLCSDCGFGNKKDNCVKCGKWVASSGVKAQLCSDCGFGNKKDNCVKCNKWIGG
ncbi:MAG TPA: hypothetical protein VNZ49_16905 [Bacteroidia bacterium]|jgi:ribosomal protein L37E|nr:hypothetical protein [Bacteroidia bacterium]